MSISKDSMEKPSLKYQGLNSAEVLQRYEKGQDNRVDSNSSRSLFDIIRANVFTLFNLILTICILVVIIAGAWKDLAFGFIVICNMFIGIIQELKAKKTLDKLSILNAPLTRVYRDGQIQEIATEKIVIDELIILKTGDQIPADGIIVDSKSIEIDESLLTGESDPISKKNGDELLSGSFVVAGTARAKIIRVGNDSFAAKIAKEAKHFSLVNSELRNGINRILINITWLLIPMIFLVINSQMQSNGGWFESFTSGYWRDALVSSVASIVGMIPEGLVLLTSISFGLAAIKLARRNVLVQELPAVEGLARVNVVCLDKTGTLTEGTISLGEIFPLNSAFTEEQWSKVLATIASDENANATALALKKKFGDIESLNIYDTVPFSSESKWSSYSIIDKNSKISSWVLGAPEILAPKMKYTDKSLEVSISKFTQQGHRVLLLAYIDDKIINSALPDNKLVPTLLISFEEQIRSDAAETLQYFREQEMCLKIISGDNTDTVASVAKRVGFSNSIRSYDARELPESLDEISSIVDKYDIFGRVTPEQKKNIVKALQLNNKVVAMTGDGINDALALKEADIGIAMGSGAAATKAVSRIVLLDGKFSHLPGVVAEGRKVIANVERVSSLFLTKTVYAIITSLFVGIFLLKYPFLPRQLSVVSALTIGIPAFCLALLSNKRLYISGFLPRVLKFAIPSGIVVAVSILSIYSYSLSRIDIAEAQNITTITAFCVAFWVLLVLARPLQKITTLLLVGLVVAFISILAINPLSRFFALQIPDKSILLATIVVIFFAIIFIEILYAVLKKLGALLPREN